MPIPGTVCKKGICTVKGCGKPFKARGLCSTHYTQWQKKTGPKCLVEECNKPVHVGGRCQKHYLRYKHYSSDELPNKLSLEERFWDKVDKDGPEHTILGKCWDWVAASDIHGYGRFGVNDKLILAHRMSYSLLVGPVPDTLSVLHACDRPCCVNPEHLFIGTQADNMADCKKKGRAAGAVGESSPNAKLTVEKVKEARRRYKPFCRTNGCKPLAKELGVSFHTLYQALTKKTWNHVE